MKPETGDADRNWACAQVEQYRAVRPRYVACARLLQQVLEQAARRLAPLAIVQTRPKSIPSFAEKALRKKGKYRDPLLRMTDLCGGRVIAQTQAEVEAVCRFIERSFAVDQENSVDVSQRLKPAEFGYRSIHYVVQFRPGVFPSEAVPVEIPPELYPDPDCPMKAEVQVRTVLEHAWAAFGHDMVYKSAFRVPDKWQRELAILAGTLESADRSFARIQAGLRTYAASYGEYMRPEQMREEIEILSAVLACDPQDVDLAHRIGKLSMILGDWEAAVELFSKYVGSGYRPLLRDLGVALCKIHAGDRGGAQYRHGRAYLEAACAPPDPDPDALASLAGTWKGVDEGRARLLYRQAYEADPTEPYAVANYLVAEILHQGDLGPAALMAPAVGQAIQRSRDQAGVGMNLPWAFYNLGMFHLLLGRPYESLAAYAKAVQLSDDWMIATSLRTLEQLSAVGEGLSGYEWARRLLVAGRAAKSPQGAGAQLEELATPGFGPLSGPVVIVAGGCDAAVEDQMRLYLPLVLEAFRDFEGTILSGGTTAGISGLVGSVGEARPQSVRTLGYVPKLVPAGAVVDGRYNRILVTSGDDFSPLEPLQAWIDLLAAGVDPRQVKVLGINGGRIAALEYRIGLALGASVGVVEGSGREAARLFPDEDWSGSKGLIHLPDDPMTVRAFVGFDGFGLEAPLREALAQAIHAGYRDEQLHRKPGADPALAGWEKLQEGLRESNRRQADHILAKLRQAGCTLSGVKGRRPRPFEFTPQEVETLAEMEHGRWVHERLLDGWQRAAGRDPAHKTSPSLVPWAQLPEEARELDREAVRRIPPVLAAAGLEIRRRKKAGE